MTDPGFWKRAAPAVAIASTLPAYTIAGGLCGAMLDRALDTDAGFTIGLAFAGFAAGVVQLFRGLSRNPPQTPDDDDDAKPPSP